jgi:hypothetical protein
LRASVLQELIEKVKDIKKSKVMVNTKKYDQQIEN